MKTIKYILIIFCATIGLLAQDKEPLPMKFKWGGSNLYRVFDTNATQFKQKEFLIGTQWGHTPKYYIGMNNNAAAGRFGKHSLDYMYEKPITTIYQPHVGDCFVPFRISPAMHYDPALSYSDIDNSVFHPNDPTSSVFGFTWRSNFFAYIDSSNTNRRLKVKHISDINYSDNGYTILSELSEQPRFTTGISDASQNGGYYGHRWFISVNMRRLSDTSLNSTKLITLKIRYNKRHNNQVAWDYINYDSIPCIKADYDTLPWGRGKQQRMQKYLSNSATPMKEFTITTDMFERSNEDITISASFLTMEPHSNNEYYNNRYQINPEFTNGGFTDRYRIEDLDIEVYSHNLDSVAIDYIKIESENAFYMSRGYLDEMPEIDSLSDKYLHVIANYNYDGNKFEHIDTTTGNNPFPYDKWAKPFAIKETMQGWLNNEENSATISGTDTKLRQPLRFYIQDTESDKPHFWWQLRYANLITNGLAVTRDLPYKHKLYKYYTKARNRYIGIKIQENESMNALPFIKKGHQGNDSLANIPYFLGYKYGYSDIPAQNPHLSSDTVAPLISSNNHLYSNYETALAYWVPSYLQEIYDTVNSRYACRSRLFDIIRHLDLNNPDEFDIYNGIANSSSSVQINWEYSLRDKFYNHQDMLYSDDAWWMNYFLGGEYYEKQYSNPNIKLTRVHCGRFKTGEETRLLLYGSILKGAKGFFYDRECDALYNSPEEGKAQIIGLCVGDSIKALVKYQNYGYYPDDYTPFNQYKSILSDTVGNDFYFCGQDPAKMETDSIKSKKTNIASTLGVAEDRIYLGMRSTRTEVYKISQLIRRLEQNKRRRLSVYPHDLMDLRLVAWYGKGFTKMYSQHPEYKEGDLMNKYLDRDSIRTAKLYQPYRYSCFQNVNDSLNVSYWENIDSSFFDVTILTPKNESILNLSSYYIGVQNRRTDPLVWDIPTQKMQFYSTAEFEDKCNERNSDNNYWQNLFWRRLGCRLISLKVNRTKPTTKSYFNFSFRINEILSQDTEFNDTYSSWRSDKYCHKVDYYVSYYHTVYNPEIRIKFLPGEGKLLKVKHNNNYLSYNDACPVASDIYLRYDLVLDAGESLVYDIELVNNTKNELKDLPILYKFLSDDVNINLNEFINHSNLHPDCYDENKLKRVSIIDSVSPQGNRQIARIKVDKKAGLPELVYRFDVVSKDGKPCDQVFINTDNHIKEYYSKGYKGKKSHTSQPEFVSSLEVNPNPANDKLIVNFMSSEVSTYKLRIYDINGSVVYSQDNSVSSTGTNELTLDISSLPVGVYNLSLEINNSIFNIKFSIDR